MPPCGFCDPGESNSALDKAQNSIAVCGLLYDAGALGPLRRQLDWLSMDAPLSRQLGRAARHHVVARYSVERMATEYDALYADALWRRERRAIREAMAA